MPRGWRARSWPAAFGAAVLMAGCASITPPSQRYTVVTPFSAMPAGERLPPGWQSWTLSRFKKSTLYRLVKDADGQTIVQAEADGAASGLIKELDIDPSRAPWLSWRWQVPELIASADNTRRDAEDSPVRVIVAFDGDPEKLDFEDRAVASRVKALTGRDMPYATLMYIWENQRPVGEVIHSPHTSRVRMIVVESGPQRSGQWLHFERNVAEDFRNAFGEPAGHIRSVGIMTDTDNTGERTRAFYGDIKFSA
ncbi:MAG TPA: DUF3047 domain-containing protein, partial [Usitatibacteraceae bacterium]|nr:DUF3047 domain-containing protein [Usitatibacteraceae bacterium]